MDRDPVDSKHFKSIGYEPAARVLEVEFADGSVYQFRKVPPITYVTMTYSPSIDHYFDKHIRGRFPSRLMP